MSGTAYMRVGAALINRRKFGPKGEGHPSIGDPCYACGWSIKEGDYTTLIPLGPGDDEEEQAKAREGRYYNAVAIEVHWSCATGEPNTGE